MRIYDITLPMSDQLPTWPNDPPLETERISQIEKGDNCNVTWIKTTTHVGTHVDAPLHFLSDGKGIDELSLKDLIGRVYVLHLPDVDIITADLLRKHPMPPRTRRLLLKTRNSEIWDKGGSHASQFNKDFVALSTDAAEYLVEKNFRLIGIDYLSIAPFSDPIPVHRILLGAGIIILEGLNLSIVKQGRFTMYCLPLKIVGADGAPARTILLGG